MAPASRALLLAKFRTLPAYGVVRPLAAAAGNLLPAGPWLSPAVAPGTTTAKAAVMCIATRQATSSPTPSLPSCSRANGRRPAAVDRTELRCGDSEETTSDEDERPNAEDATSEDDDSDVEEKTSYGGGSSSQKTIWSRAGAH